MNIIIVEDQIFQALSIKLSLQKAGFSVLGIAHNDKEAVSLARNMKPNLMIVDISLKGRGIDDLGAKAAFEIQKFNKAIHFVFLTGVKLMDRTMNLIRKINSSNYTFVRKLVNRNQLIDIIKSIPPKIEWGEYQKKEENLIFICYSHMDYKWMEEMVPFLRPLKDKGIHAWRDKEIGIGEIWQDAIEKSLMEAKAAILLISIHFVNSIFIKEVELPRLLAAAKKKGVLIIPVYVEHVPSNYIRRLSPEENSFSLLDYQSINSPEDSIDNWEKPKRNQECWGKISMVLEDKFG